MTEALALFEAHKNPLAQSWWLPLKSGLITAAGAPSPKRLRAWSEHQVTDVVTLQRADEMRSTLPQLCEAHELRWHHLPLSGKRLEAPEDLQALAGVHALLQRLEDPKTKMVVHCAAGMHRTGVCLYLMLRSAGVAPEESVRKVEQARALTGRELQRTMRSGRLADLAEAIHVRLTEARTSPESGA